MTETSTTAEITAIKIETITAITKANPAERRAARSDIKIITAITIAIRMIRGRRSEMRRSWGIILRSVA